MPQGPITMTIRNAIREGSRSDSSDKTLSAQLKTSGRLSRTAVTALDEMLGVRLPVLDDGFVRLIDYMGDDSSVVQAARVSYGAGTKRIQEDRGLIRYLMRHSHTTPFEMCEIKLHVRAPMDVWRQWIRHRTANVNEYSTRYSIAIDSAQKRLPRTGAFSRLKIGRVAVVIFLEKRERFFLMQKPRFNRQLVQFTKRALQKVWPRTSQKGPAVVNVH